MEVIKFCNREAKVKARIHISISKNKFGLFMFDYFPKRNL